MGEKKMKVKMILDEDIVNYKKMSMFIATCKCNFKCCTDLGLDICICQNSPIAKQKNIVIDDEKIVQRYLDNPLTSAVVIAGLQPFQQFDELYNLIKAFREKTDDDIVIYTGFYESQKQDEINKLKQFKNIIIKFGRFIPGQEVHKDRVLGVNLVNKQQYAVKIS